MIIQRDKKLTDAVGYCQEAIKMLHTEFLPFPKIEFSNKLQTSTGMAYFSQFKIALATRIWEITSTEENRNTTIHEYCHLAAFKLGNDLGHGNVWKYCMERCGLEPKRCHNIEIPGRIESLECNCGQKIRITARQKSKAARGITKYQCPSCKSPIEIKLAGE